MHSLLIGVVPAREPAEAAFTVKDYVMGQEAPLYPEFDYGYTLDEEKARFREAHDGAFKETGAVPADSEAGQEAIEAAWERTLKEAKRNIALLRASFERAEDDELLDDPMVEDVDVEQWNPLGLAQSEDELATTTSGYFLHTAHSLGRYGGPGRYLYREHYAEAVRTPSDYDQLQTDILDDPEKDELEWYVAGADVHY